MAGLQRRGPMTLVPNLDDYVRAHTNDDEPIVDVSDPANMSEAAE